MKRPGELAICVVGWGITLAAAVAALIWVTSCTGDSAQQKLAAATSDTIACEAELTRRVLEADSCNEAQFKIEATLATMKECRSYPHFQVCGLLQRDGGYDGDH